MYEWNTPQTNKNHLNVNGFRDGTHFIVWDISNSVNKTNNNGSPINKSITADSKHQIIVCLPFNLPCVKVRKSNENKFVYNLKS